MEGSHNDGSQKGSSLLLFFSMNVSSDAGEDIETLMGFWLEEVILPLVGCLGVAGDSPLIYDQTRSWQRKKDTLLSQFPPKAFLN